MQTSPPQQAASPAGQAGSSPVVLALVLQQRSSGSAALLGAAEFAPAAWVVRKIGEGMPLYDTAANPVIGIISLDGHVINGSGGLPPQNAFVSLTIYENGNLISQINIPLDRTGFFRFDLVPWSPAYSYQVSTTYNDLSFGSGLINGNGLMPGMLVDVSILVYDNSTNNQFLHALRMKAVYDFSAPGKVQVSENIIISNPSSLVIIPAGDTVPVLNFILPKGAMGVTFPDGNPSNRYRLTAEGFGDWQPIMPGDGHQVMVQYSVPFTDELHCNLTTPIPLDSLVVVVKGTGIETVGSGMQLKLVQSDTASAQSIFSASGLSSEENFAINFTTRDHIQRVWLGILFFVVIVFVSLIWVIQSNHLRSKAQLENSVAQNPENEDTVMDSIIALDDRHKHGDISSEAYSRSRAELVEKLETLKKLNKG
jgi:uncharacterized membrane protein